MLKLLLVLIAACATAELFWWIVGIAAVVGVVWYVSRGYRAAAAEERAERLESRRRAQALAADADREHRLVLADDDRGYYGQFPPTVT